MATENNPKAENPDRARKAAERAAKKAKAENPEPAVKGPKTSTLPPGYTPRLQKLYTGEIRAKLKDELQLANVMQVPRLKKIVLNMGIGEGTRDEKILQQAEVDLTAIAGMKPKRTRAKMSVAAFKLRQ